MPAILFAGVGTRQQAAWTLYGEVQIVEQPSDMTGVVTDMKLFLDDPGNHWRGPDAAVQSIRDRSAVEQVTQLGPLCVGQQRRSARAIPLQQPFDAVLLIAQQPFRNLRSGRFENSGHLAAATALRVEDHRLQPLGHPVGPVAFCLLTQTHQPAIGLRCQAQASCTHNSSRNEEYAISE